ncbi:hypothetical protein [Arthrobacter burdickii]|jgi:hypothetical protein|uniref:Uncharacterized protein n=1 Tax=Arthrobacter burdickii TaxID=3035920 RepID=A0ABT8K2Z5_9MICC|nr:hypothetical protein [Arthrobacter burdickii]MDN4611808.1 hypothetical protein [Arthrobacter burdickii]
MRKVQTGKPVSVAATVLFASLLGAWLYIRIQQGFALGVAADADAQIFRMAAAALLFAPFIALIYLCVNPQTVLRNRSSPGSPAFAALGFIWLLCGLFLSLFVGFAPF